ncbi:hypothetical protein R1T16_10320 [Flavobacterium sp. DG1-102-2]|uniref:hypothetical protein n=1 Tax=Flavobacterium sp. DG1-102-2 TaxID=3081663 RepID=UPI00294902E3|nr:hypothetical protein [Flavobacterium sp. DG1-102-2]MDV6168820.1 hypothetical protein [Flavobacterium sp. DG1-102-2]
MKKLIVMSGLAILLMASCKKKEEPVPPPPPPVEDPAPPPAPKPMTQTPPATPPPPPVEQDGTSVSVGSDGISVKNKNGEAKNNVTISKKKTEMEFKSN